MKTEKMSLKGIKNVLSRAEMKKIMAGSSPGPNCCWCIYNNSYVLSTGGSAVNNNTSCIILCQSTGYPSGGVYQPGNCVG